MTHEGYFEINFVTLQLKMSTVKHLAYIFMLLIECVENSHRYFNVQPWLVSPDE